MAKRYKLPSTLNDAAPMPSSPVPILLTPTQIARTLQVHPRTIHRYVRDGVIPYIPLPGKIRFDHSAVMDALSKRSAQVEQKRNKKSDES